ncbi:MAG: hypothetical protein GDA52_03960 [Rhodobacteraceae bacterium]|nr:hypothetical protein [Paracoccaceae bacterium]
MSDIAPDSIAYGPLMHRAMRGLVRTVLEHVAEHGLPGKHHFFITFDTRHPRAALADWLTERYPEEMTIIIQHWFNGLEVDNNGFSITLNFGNTPEPLYVPFDAILTFVDPSVKFGLRFETGKQAPVPADGPLPSAEPADRPPAPDVPNGQNAEVVSLDRFRKSH